MSLKSFLPTTPSNRGRLITLRSKLWKENSINKLTTGLSKKSGRNNFGRITVFTKGGGHSNNYRKIDFRRSLINIPAIVNLNKTYLKGQVVEIVNNIIKIDAGLKSNILITKNEYNKYIKSKSLSLISNTNVNNICIGDTIRFYFYQFESILNDSIIDFKSLTYKIIRKEYLKYKKYVLPMILSQKVIENEPIKGIIIPKKRKRKKRLKMLVGIGGLLIKIKNRESSTNDLNIDLIKKNKNKVKYKK